MIKKDKSVITLIVAGFIVAIFISFFGGIYYGKSSNSQDKNKELQGVPDQLSGNRSRPNGFDRMQGDRPIQGVVNSISGKTIILTSQIDDASKTVVVADNTNITDNGVDAVLSNIKINDPILVVGTTSTDGSIKAQMIKINPATNLGNSN